MAIRELGNRRRVLEAMRAVPMLVAAEVPTEPSNRQFLLSLADWAPSNSPHSGIAFSSVNQQLALRYSFDFSDLGDPLFTPTNPTAHVVCLAFRSSSSDFRPSQLTLAIAGMTSPS